MRPAAIALAAVMLVGCQTAPKAPEPQPISDQELALYGLPPRDVLMAMFKSPTWRPVAMKMVLDAQRMKMGLPPDNYPGNCRYTWQNDAIGNNCGERSAESRPGGY